MSSQEVKWCYLAHTVDAHSPDREPLHILLAPPEADVVLEGEHVKDAVQDGHKEGDRQEVGVPLQQHPLQLIALPVSLCAKIPLQRQSTRFGSGCGLSLAWIVAKLERIMARGQNALFRSGYTDDG